MKKCALIVDDEPAIVTGLRLRLEAVGWRTLTANDGLNCLRLATRHRPDLVVLDVRMPDQDGLQTLAEIRNCPETADIPVVMISGSAEDRQEALHAGANAFLTKPHRTHDFLQVISDLADTRAHRPGAVRTVTAAVPKT